MGRTKVKQLKNLVREGLKELEAAREIEKKCNKDKAQKEYLVQVIKNVIDKYSNRGLFKNPVIKILKESLETLKISDSEYK